MPVRAPLDCALAEPVYVVPVIAFRCAAAVLLAGALGAPVLADEVAAAPAPERAEQVAKLLGLHPPVAAEPDQALARLRARTQALLQIERLSLRIDGTMARIEREQFEAANARQNLDSRSGKTATTYNLVAVLVGSGTTALGTALQFGNDNEIRAGYGIIIGGAAIAAAFTIAALVQKQRGKTHFPIRTDLWRSSSIERRRALSFACPSRSGATSIRSSSVSRPRFAGSCWIGSPTKAASRWRRRPPRSARSISCRARSRAARSSPRTCSPSAPTC